MYVFIHNPIGTVHVSVELSIFPTNDTQMHAATEFQSSHMKMLPSGFPLWCCSNKIRDWFLEWEFTASVFIYLSQSSKIQILRYTALD